MPKTLNLGNDNSGITITWTPSASRLDISGYFDEFVGIEGGSFTLAGFFRELGITEKDVRKALKEVASNGRL
jgi:predicted transcriptional regulator